MTKPMTRPTQAQTQAYFDKIGFRDEIRLDVETLIKIVEGHICAFPFETISLHDANATRFDRSLEFKDMFERLVNQNRGGHCVVLNLMLQTMLSRIGFTVKPILADTLWKSPEPLGERSKHCAGIVTIDGEDYLVDAGFGSVGLLSPIPLKEGVYQQYHQCYKIILSTEYPFECQVLNGKKWESIYGIIDKKATLQEYKAINAIQSNPLNAKCSFSTIFLCTKPCKEGEVKRIRIFNEKLQLYKKNVVEVYNITSKSLSKDLLTHFGIDLSGHTLRYTENALKKHIGQAALPEPILYTYNHQVQATPTEHTENTENYSIAKNRTRRNL